MFWKKKEIKQNKGRLTENLEKANQAKGYRERPVALYLPWMQRQFIADKTNSIYKSIW